MRSKRYARKKPKYYDFYQGYLVGVVDNILNQDFKTTKPYEKYNTYDKKI